MAPKADHTIVANNQRNSTAATAFEIGSREPCAAEQEKQRHRDPGNGEAGKLVTIHVQYSEFKI